MHKRPWLTITDDEYTALKESGTTWDEVMRQYDQPSWCGYNNALAGGAGCWSLVGRKIRGEADCHRCDCYQPEAEGQTNG